jgi:UPF0755 protein
VIKIIGLFLGSGLMAIGLFVAWQLGYFPVGGASEKDSSAEQTFLVQKGENFIAIANRLEREGVIRSSRALRWYVNYWARGARLQRGEFGVRPHMPIPELVTLLAEGKPFEVRFTVPEGHNIFQIAEALEQKGLAKAKDFIAAASDPSLIKEIPTLDENRIPRTIEGYLFPDTYSLQKIFTSREIAEIFLDRFKEVYGTLKSEIESSALMAELKLSPAELIVLASIVEKETGAAIERPLIASVFANRLRKGMRLQTDPTVIYGKWVQEGRWDGNIRRRDLEEPTPYNTYTIARLPPGPIANPGINSIRAVLRPTPSEYLFFVSRNDGTHIFSANYGDHNRAVRATQLNPKAKEGKSWRDLPTEKRAR